MPLLSFEHQDPGNARPGVKPPTNCTISFFFFFLFKDRWKFSMCGLHIAVFALGVSSLIQKSECMESNFCQCTRKWKSELGNPSTRVYGRPSPPLLPPPLLLLRVCLSMGIFLCLGYGVQEAVLLCPVHYSFPALQLCDFNGAQYSKGSPES